MIRFDYERLHDKAFVIKLNTSSILSNNNINVVVQVKCIELVNIFNQLQSTNESWMSTDDNDVFQFPSSPEWTTAKQQWIISSQFMFFTLRWECTSFHYVFLPFFHQKNYFSKQSHSSRWTQRNKSKKKRCIFIWCLSAENSLPYMCTRENLQLCRKHDEPGVINSYYERSHFCKHPLYPGKYISSCSNAPFQRLNSNNIITSRSTYMRTQMKSHIPRLVMTTSVSLFSIFF